MAAPGDMTVAENLDSDFDPAATPAAARRTEQAAPGPPMAERGFATAGSSRFAAGAEAVRQRIDRAILMVDAMIAAQLDAILHHPRFQALEARWRGLRWLAGQIEDGPGDRIIIRLLGASWREIARDMERAAEFDQSHLFRTIYEAQFGQAGGEPFGLLLVDHAVRHMPDRDNPADDKAVLEHLSRIGADAFAPVIVAAAPELLGVHTFGELAAAARPASALGDPDHQRWRELGERIDGQADPRYLAVVLPRVLARPLWQDDATRADGFGYRETVSDIADRLWMNGGYAFASVVARSAARFGWPADVRGADTDRIGGGLVIDPPDDPHRLSQTMTLPRLPLEVIFTDAQERMLIEAGLMPITALPHSDELLFGAVRSLYRPPRPGEPGGAAAFADSRVVTQINALLCACRFAHYLKVRGRQTIGRLRRPEEIELELRTWLTGFVNRNILASAETRAARPLFAADVRVTERTDKPGVFDCAIMLQPYFQLDNVSASFTFATKIAVSAT
jgi:type VI secretion system protein ImpD/type VI secretion system protein ImpC